MGVTPEGGVSQRERSEQASRSGRGTEIRDAGTAAWLVLLPCAALTALAVLWVGPWVGQRLFPPHPTYDFWGGGLTPQPRAMGRYLVALAGPILLALATALTVRRRPLVPRAAAAAVVAAAQALLVAALVVCFLGQRRPLVWRRDYFTPTTLAVAALVAVAVLAGCRSARLRELLGGRAAEPRWRRAAATAAAVALTVVWMLPSVNSDASIAWSVDVIRYHVAFHFDETFAVLNGLTPLVTFTPQYSALWPYVFALPMLAFGKTLLVFTIAASAATALALLGIFGVLRRVTRNSLTALLLFLPFLATTLFIVAERLDNRYTFGTYFAMFPLRYGGPYLLAWLTARHLSAPGRRRTWPLFAAAGLVLLNNTDFGAAALGATLAALLWTRPPRRDELLRLAGSVVAGLAAAVALVAALTLVRSGSLPQPARLTEFARIFGLNGYSSIPIPSVRGLPTIIYVTYAAALATATALALRGARDRVLTGMLAWIGVFGLGAAVYYATRADPDVLPSLFSPWSLALALLAVATLRSLAVRPLRGRAAMALVVLLGLGVTTCSIAQLPLPGPQLARVRENPGRVGIDSPDPLVPSADPDVRRFFSSLADGPRRFVVRRGAPVAILETTGHRIADAYGVRNVTPYTGADSILTAEQLDDTLDALRRAGGNTILLPRSDNAELNRELIRRGFEVVTTHGLRDWPARDGSADLEDLYGIGVIFSPAIKWVDARRLHPAALR